MLANQEGFGLFMKRQAHPFLKVKAGNPGSPWVPKARFLGAREKLYTRGALELGPPESLGKPFVRVFPKLVRKKPVSNSKAVEALKSGLRKLVEPGLEVTHAGMSSEKRGENPLRRKPKGSYTMLVNVGLVGS